jgi:NTE family protein
LIGNPDQTTLGEWLAQEPFSMALSSGFFGFFAHFGFLDALQAAGFGPAHVSGSSAGAMAAAYWACGLNVSDLKPRLFTLKRSDFWDPALGPGLLKGQRFRAILEEIYPVARIEQCSTRLSISAFDLLSLSTHTLRRGRLRDAVYASCSVPLLFHPLRIGGALYLDGGIADRPAFAGLPVEGRILYHHLEPRRPSMKCDHGLNRLLQARPNTVAIGTQNVEAVNPGKLNLGRQAFDQVRAATKKAFSLPVINRRVMV